MKDNAQKLNDFLEATIQFKIERSLNLIENALYEHKNPIISSSFGKDSVVLTHLVHRIDESVPIVFNSTGVQFPETLEYKRKLKNEWNLDIHEVEPERTFFDIVHEHGYPKTSRNSKTGDSGTPACCRLLKEYPARDFLQNNGYDLDFVGLIGDEGRQRKRNFINKGGHYYMKGWDIHKCTPLIWWKSDDIWEYINAHDIPENPVYKKYDIERTGCITCTGHKGWKNQIAKYSKDLLKFILKDMNGQTNFEDFNTKMDDKRKEAERDDFEEVEG